MKTRKRPFWPATQGRILFSIALGLAGASFAQTGPTPSNLPPVAVAITVPTNGAVFYTPADIQIIALAHDGSNGLANVEFFAGTTSLGVVSNGVIVDPIVGRPFPPPGTRAYFLTWSNAPAGAYLLSAVALANDGLSATSAPVKILVQPGPPPPPTNYPPLVRITSPPNHSVFRAPANIPLYAYALDPDGYVQSVEFFEDGNSLGFGHRLPTPIAGAGGIVSPVPPTFPTNLFVLIWTNAPPGTNIVLDAVATDNGGLSTTSAPVDITILPPLPPPTNRPPVVNIVATDPIAIEGTNCWPWLGLAGNTPTWSNWVSATAICRFFTNCGPKNATFTVRRFGDTNADLTVPYRISGTASNGVDYVMLPGSVTIPAGETRATITVVPIDDGPPDITSTVVLGLEPSTNTPPDYLVGFPRDAAALIIDKKPRPASAVLPGKYFHLATSGPDGAWFHIEYTTDLTHWTPICTNQVVNGWIDFVDPDASSNQSRFYRAVPDSGPPE